MDSILHFCCQPTVWPGYNISQAIRYTRSRKSRIWRTSFLDIRTVYRPIPHLLLSCRPEKLWERSYKSQWIFLHNVLASYIEEQWYPEISHHTPSAKILLVGTQLDLRDDPEVVENLMNQYATHLTILSQLIRPIPVVWRQLLTNKASQCAKTSPP